MRSCLAGPGWWGVWAVSIEDKHIIYRASDPEAEMVRLAILRVGYSEVYPQFRITRPAKAAYTMKLVVAGQGMIQTPVGRHSFKAGDVVLYWKGCPYEWWTNPRHLLHHYWVDLDGPLVPELFAQTVANSGNPVLSRPSTPSGETALVEELMAAGNDKSSASFWRVLSCFFALWQSIIASLPAAEAFKTSRPIAVSAKDFIDMHYMSHITLSDIAAAVGVAPGYLSTLFSAEYGVPPYAYAIQRRLELAHSLLAIGCKVRDAANSVGYSDTGYFARLFHQRYGYTPSSVIARYEAAQPVSDDTLHSPKSEDCPINL